MEERSDDGSHSTLRAPARTARWCRRDDACRPSDRARRVARVWGEPGPYGGVFVQGMNEWAQRNNAKIRFEVEQIPWDGVTVKLSTDLAARPP
jgi:hypothetical protein